MATILLLIVAAFAAGVMNAIAGGGQFLTFPALVAAGVPVIAANASSTVAVVPGGFSSAWAYRNDFQPIEGVRFTWLIVASLIGGVLGAILLLWTPEHDFDVLVPWLLLAATIVFAFGRQVTPWLRSHFRIGPAALVAIQFCIGIYGGYFGGAIGILMLALMGLFGLTDINAMNASKTVLASCMNGVAVICFIIAGKVYWTQTLIMLVAALIGGYLGAQVARRIDQRIQRILITTVGAIMTVLFFLRSYA